MVTAIERAAEAPQLLPYLRDVQDHLLLVNEEVSALRDLLGTILEANMAVISVEQTNVSVRQNATVEQLTILATIFLPLTFVTGFFGQNFGWLVRHQDSFAAFVIYGIGGRQCRWRFWPCGSGSALTPGRPPHLMTTDPHPRRAGTRAPTRRKPEEPGSGHEQSQHLVTGLN